MEYNFFIPPRYLILKELRPYFDDIDILMTRDDEELESFYGEVQFFKFNVVERLDGFA